MRNGAWQPLACTRLPECNFPVITLPNFSASVKDHLLTQQSQACAARSAALRSESLPTGRENTFAPSLPACAGSPGDQPRADRWLPAAQSLSLGACHPIALSHTPTPPARHQPQVSASPLSPIVVSGTLSPSLSRSSTSILTSGSVCLHGTFPGSPPLSPSCLTTTAVPSPQTITPSSAALVTVSPTPPHSHTSTHRGTHSQTPL